MKKTILTLAVCTTVFLACNKNDDPAPAPATPTDSTAPVISITGNAKDTISLNSTYSDLGAIAVDNVDGNITAKIVVTGNLNTNAIGDYVKKYNVTDAAGNAAAEMTRNIHVRNDAGFLAGTYAVVPNCGSTPSANYSSNITVSSTVNNQISISYVHNNQTGQPVVGVLTNGNVVLNGLSGNGNTFGGSGPVSANKKVINLSTSSSTGGGFPSFCTGVWTRN
jgi:hypothetical protein